MPAKVEDDRGEWGIKNLKGTRENIIFSNKTYQRIGDDGKFMRKWWRKDLLAANVDRGGERTKKKKKLWWKFGRGIDGIKMLLSTEKRKKNWRKSPFYWENKGSGRGGCECGSWRGRKQSGQSWGRWRKKETNDRQKPWLAQKASDMVEDWVGQPIEWWWRAVVKVSKILFDKKELYHVACWILGPKEFTIRSVSFSLKIHN